jgi:hypothetical protein
MPSARGAAAGALGVAPALWTPVRKGAALVMGLPVWAVLAAVVLAQWLVVAVIASIASHNGVVFYTGGDDTWYYTSAWVLGHGHVPQGAISYGYPFLIAPIARLAGARSIAGLPYIIALNLIVLWPIALACVYGIAKTIAGRGFAYVASFAWTVFPLVSIPYFYSTYHVRFVDQALPPAVGLVSTGDFPSMVCLLVAAYFTLVACRGNPRAALVAGLAIGFAATVKPANLIFLPAPLAALVVARRGRELLYVCACLVPALVGLALWKYRGLGRVPALSHSATGRLADGVFTPLPAGSLDVHHYIRVNWGRLWRNMLDIREYTWSLRMVTWAVIAAVIALFRRSAVVGLVVGGWLASFIILKGSATGVDVKSGAFFRYMVPAFPAFFFGLAAIPLLVPVWGRRLAAAGAAERLWPAGDRAWRSLLAVAAVVTVVPIVALAAFRPLTTPSATEVPAIDQYVPVNVFALTAKQKPDGSIVVSWPRQDANGTRVAYQVFREPTDGLECTLRRHAAALCTYYTDTFNSLLVPLQRTASTTFRDHPQPGTWIYRVAATTSPGGTGGIGNFMTLSRPAQVTATAY